MSLENLCDAGVPAAPTPTPVPAAESQLHDLVSAELLREANAGREILDEDGRFVFPESVKRVWIDVGAHKLLWTRKPAAKGGSRSSTLGARCWTP
jgi:hypothetical protein